MPPFEPDKTQSRERRDLIVPFVFLVLSGLLLVLPMPLQQRVSSLLRGSVLLPFVRTQESLQEARVRAGDVTLLQGRLDSLVALRASERTLEEENERLRSLLALRERAGPSFVPASAVRPGTPGAESMFLLDVGTAQGVQVNDPVIVAEGLVGVVREAGTRQSLAMDWTHPDFRASVMTPDGVAFGIVEPRRGRFREEDRLLLSSVPYHTPVEVGVEVVTSGQGTVYPRGIPVGWVQGEAESDEGWRRSYWLSPAAPPGRAGHVLVLTRRSGSAEPFDSAEGLSELWAPPAPAPEGAPEMEP